MRSLWSLPPALVLGAWLLACAPTPEAAPREGVTGKTGKGVVRVVVPERDNLQHLSFWVAQGAGFFKDEGLDVQIVVPPAPLGASTALLQGEAEVGLLPPPMYLPLIEQGRPIVIFANLLQNGPINLVVRKEVLEARNLSPTAPLADRLKGMRGLRVGVTHGPPPRLRALFASVGLDADRDIQMIIIPGEQQNQAFADNRVDALYAHTPYLEKALVEQGAVLLVNQSRGEVPELVDRQIHSLVTTRSYAAANREVIVALTRGVYRAQQLVHADLKAATDALFRSGVPGLERRLVETILAIYQPAIPKTPEVSTEGVLQQNKFFPGPRPPDLSKINVANYLAPQFARHVITGEPLSAP